MRSSLLSMREPSELPEDVARFAEAEVAAERDEAERNWLTYAREAWNEGVAASARGDTTELTSAEFSAWLDRCLDEASR